MLNTVSLRNTFCCFPGNFRFVCDEINDNIILFHLWCQKRVKGEVQGIYDIFYDSIFANKYNYYKSIDHILVKSVLGLIWRQNQKIRHNHLLSDQFTKPVSLQHRVYTLYCKPCLTFIIFEICQIRSFRLKFS